MDVGGLFALDSVQVKVDDQVGAISVHLVCGVFGTLAVGLFAQDLLPNTTGNGLFFGGGTKLLWAQLAGVVAAGVFTFAISLIVWGLMKATIGIRVSPEEEMEGLDVGEHGITAYPDFQLAATIRTPGAARVSGAEAVALEPSFVRAKVPSA
ncbi:MAG: ammonium transporter [candidate division NC10 bacterium]|nr:ammonium transporter [candidate division NC10 bacterium]